MPIPILGVPDIFVCVSLKIYAGILFRFAFWASFPPLVIITSFAFLFFASFSSANVSSVFPLYEIQITRDLFVTDFGSLYPWIIENGFFRSSANSSFIVWAPSPDPPIPIATIWSADLNVFGSLICFVSDHACLH